MYHPASLIWAVHHAISIGYADGAYVYARMLMRQARISHPFMVW